MYIHIGEEREAFDNLIASTSNAQSESSVATIAHGGGEAPATAIESGDELASSVSRCDFM